MIHSKLAKDKRDSPSALVPPSASPSHGNAEHEIHKAYNGVIDAGTIFFWDRKGIPGVNPDEVVTLYKLAFQAHRNGAALTAERWARTAKHLARALSSEAKIAYLEPRVLELPFLKGAGSGDFDLKAHSDTPEDLLNSLSEHLPALSSKGLAPNLAHRYFLRAKRHLGTLEQPEYRNELLRAERIKAAHEYGRSIECLALVCEAETDNHPQSAA